ncbi:hypothetical protein [Dysgonomonas sp. 511]|uniref:hypothetical protein n=1 Tax=Dysgonomonas sp. 511 TaxID=2302930 RepID=UPI0013D5F851|nr:hypothetical protein [Dysgonomonas sp. 511]
MILEYINRKKEPHYFIAKATKLGKERFYIVKDKTKYEESDLLVNIPQGFEIYEYPEDGRVVLRKILKSIIAQDEIEIVNGEMEKHLTVKDYLIDKTENSIIVYLGYLDKEDGWGDEEQFLKIQSYDFTLRFEKTSDGKYKAQRFCCLSRYYGWITMETNENLEYLAEKYCFHIDKESLLQFWIEGEEDW